MTVCTSGHRQLLGEVVAGEVRLGGAGRIASDEWRSLAKRFQGLFIDAFIIMPNHLHGILFFPDTLESLPRLGEVVRSFKSVSTRRIRKEGMSSFAWQRNFFDRIVRTEAELLVLRRYVAENPQKWDLDRNNPGAADLDAARRASR